jgi:hypothetical protein
MAEQASFNDQTDKRNRQWGQNDCSPEPEWSSAQENGYGIAEESAQHIKRSMGQVGNPQHPKDKTQTRRDNKQYGGSAQSYDKLLRKSRKSYVDTKFHATTFADDPYPE